MDRGIKSIALILATFLYGCSTSKTMDAPSWVSGLRSGDQSLEIEVGNKLYFRRQIRGGNRVESEVCDEAIAQINDDIRKHFPSAEIIPQTIEIIFYDSKIHDCSVTISVDRNIKERNDELRLLKQHNREEKKELSQQLAQAKKETAQLEQKNEAFKTLIASNVALRMHIEYMQNMESSVRSDLLKEQQIAEGIAYYGLSHDRFRIEIGHNFRIDWVVGGPCKEQRNLPASIHGNIEVCWDVGGHIIWSDRNAIVETYCSISDSKCYKKKP